MPANGTYTDASVSVRGLCLCTALQARSGELIPFVAGVRCGEVVLLLPELVCAGAVKRRDRGATGDSDKSRNSDARVLLFLLFVIFVAAIRTDGIVEAGFVVFHTSFL